MDVIGTIIFSGLGISKNFISGQENPKISGHFRTYNQPNTLKKFHYRHLNYSSYPKPVI